MLTHRIKQRFPLLRTLGVAVEYFPRYVSRGFHPQALDVALLTFILRGRGRHVIEGEVFMENGASLGVTHYDQGHDVLTDARGMEILNVYLDLQNHPLPPMPQALQSVLPLFLPLHPRFQHRLNRIVRLKFDDPGPFAEPLFAIQREMANRPPGYEEAVALHFKLFLMLCCRHVLDRGIVPSRSSSAVPRIEDLRQFLDAHYAEPHTLESLAGRAGLSRTALCRVFKSYTGKRVFDYLIERRIQAAMIRLRSGDEKVLNIALESGFHDLSYFNRKFKQIVGLAPSRYRGGE